MSTKKQRITRGLAEIGAAFASRTDRYICCEHACCGGRTQRAYHVHPDRARPETGAIRKFYNLDEIARYIEARKSANNAGSYDEAAECMAEFEEWLESQS